MSFLSPNKWSQEVPEMSSTTPRAQLLLLAIDDDVQNLDLIRESLAREGLAITAVQDPEAGIEEFRRLRHNIVLVDLMMPKIGGLEVLGQILSLDPAAEVLLMTAHYSSESAVEAIKNGAADYLTKPLDLGRLRERIETLAEQARRRSRAARLDDEMLHTFEFEGMVGRSPLMLEVYDRVIRIAPHFRSVLVTGETGTGKELVAHALHRRSPARSGHFAICNCAAVVETLVESELFGHVKGAFTGAMQDKIGLFEYANGGTVFLDEIGEMPPATQAKLLRVLQTQEIQRVGSPSLRKVNVRVVAATHRDLRAMCGEGRFREDLYYRIAMVEIRLPSLSERREDLPLLHRHLIQRFSEQYNKPIAGLSRRAQKALYRYSWPGNIRELENVLGNACMMAQSEVIDISDLPARVLASAEDAGSGSTLLSLAEVERRHAAYVLDKVGGNKLRAAEILGVSRGTLYNLIAKEKTAAD
jgi:DNA-binding NtrC family response regulator